VPTLLITNRTSGAGGASFVPAILISWHAVFTGGPLPAASTAFHRMTYRLSSEAAVWACLDGSTGQWRATALYHHLETTEKSHASYRLGSTLAGVASDLVLDIPLLVHRQTLFGRSSGPRGDLLGLRVPTFDWHGVEAKGKSPDYPFGGTRYASPREFAAAKNQAHLLGVDLLSARVSLGLNDHWAVTTRTSVLESTEIVLDDPGVDDGGDRPPRPLPHGDFPYIDPVERLLQGYYQVVGDIEALEEQGLRAGARLETELPSGVRGIVLPGSQLWIGAHELLFVARREGRLREALRTFADDAGPPTDDRGACYQLGLAIARIAPADLA
jgi:hypothetical protein